MVPCNNFPMILDTRRGRVWSERRFFRFDRLSRLLLLFREQFEEPSVAGSPVPVGTAGDITFVVDVGSRVLDGGMLVLVPSLSSPPEDVASVAMGPPGKTYSTLRLKTWKSLVRWAINGNGLAGVTHVGSIDAGIVVRVRSRETKQFVLAGGSRAIPANFDLLTGWVEFGSTFLGRQMEGDDLVPD